MSSTRAEQDVGAELHVAGIVVHVAAKRLAAVSDALARLPGTEVCATDARGKLVVTLEARSTDEMMLRLAEAQRLEGVLSALIVYQHAESAESMNDEVSDENLAT